MDIAVVTKNTLKIRGKNASLLASFQRPDSLPKLSADAVLLFEKDTKFPVEQVEGQRLVISGPGEYEVAGIKITSDAKSKGRYYTVTIDGIVILLTFPDVLEKVQDSSADYNIVVISADSEINASAVSALTPSIVALHGEKAIENAKLLGVDINDAESGVKPVAKISTTRDKLPEEMQVAIMQ